MRHQDHLLQVPLFADFTDKEVERLHAATTELVVPAGTVLMQEGQTAHEMIVLVEGLLDVTRDGHSVANIGPGGFAGELGLLNHRVRNSTVTAIAESKLIHIDGRQFAALLEDVPHLAVKMLPIVAARVQPND